MCTLSSRLCSYEWLSISVVLLIRVANWRTFFDIGERMVVSVSERGVGSLDKAESVFVR